MTVLHVKTARAIWMVDSRDLNPHGIDISEALAAVKDRYSFQIYPKTMEDSSEYGPKGLVFANGSFEFEGGRYTVVKATMYPDGLVADSALSTDFSEAFLADLLNYVSTEFGLTYKPEMIHKRLFTSELIVRPDKDLSGLFSPLAVICEQLTSLTGERFEPTGFGVSIDTVTSTARPAAFRVEREINKSFDQRRYYSSAPLSTKQHEDLLQAMEALL